MSYQFLENGNPDHVFEKTAPEADAKDVKLAWSGKAKSEEAKTLHSEPLVITTGNETTFCVVGKNEFNQQPSCSSTKDEIFDQGSSKDKQLGHKETTNTKTSSNLPAPEAVKSKREQIASRMHQNEPCSPGELRGAGLLSCFPSFKTGANRGKAYKLVMRSPNGGSVKDYSSSKELTK